jgi:hypothetical protein
MPGRGIGIGRGGRPVPNLDALASQNLRQRLMPWSPMPHPPLLATPGVTHASLHQESTAGVQGAGGGIFNQVPPRCREWIFGKPQGRASSNRQEEENNGLERAQRIDCLGCYSWQQGCPWPPGSSRHAPQALTIQPHYHNPLQG